MKVQLWDYWRSSAAYRVRIGLNLLGIGYEAVPVDLAAGEQKGKAHRAVNPQGLVPVLEIDGLRLTQSLAILEYLDETRDAGWLPGEPAERARVRAMAYSVAMEIHPVCNLSVARHAAEASGGAITMEGWMRAFIGPGLAAVEAMAAEGGGQFLGGEAIGLADIVLVPQLYNARRWGIDLGPMPRLRAVGEAAEAIEAVAAAHPDRVKPS